MQLETNKDAEISALVDKTSSSNQTAGSFSLTYTDQAVTSKPSLSNGSISKRCLGTATLILHIVGFVDI
eukprot:scaffold2761_cov264-Chaetoceros_neogracile.AAC.6